MQFRLEKRPQPSRTMLYAAPVLAVLLTMIVGAILFSAIGYNGIGAVVEIFTRPLTNPLKWQDLGVKAAPLIIIGVGLSIAYRANVWNIGAEGQYVAGALGGTAVALLTMKLQGPWILPAMVLCGIVAGMALAAIPAWLKTQFDVNEILTTLMLNYAVVQLLYYLLRTSWKDPMGFSFPKTPLFTASQSLPFLWPGTIMHWGVPIALIVAVLAWVVMTRSVFGFQVRVVGSAPNAARYGGFSARRTIWLVMLVSGGLAGLAGVLEAAGPFRQLVPSFSTGYGFTAIIVAFLGRLNPLGVVVAGVVLAISYVGGEIAQTTLGLPSAATGIFQGMLLFFLLAGDVLVRYRLRVVSPAPAGEAA
jgi:general nucleoside transport system permease protein